jgi:hypothetical protein
LHICAPINQHSFGFSEIAILEFEIYNTEARLQREAHSLRTGVRQ